MERGEKKTGSAFTSGPLLLRIIDHYHLCDLEWDKGKQWLHLEKQTGSALSRIKYSASIWTKKLIVLSHPTKFQCLML